MLVANSSEIRNKFKGYLDKAYDNCEPILIKRKNGKDMVILSLETYKSLDETKYLLSNPYNKKALLEALNDIEEGETVTFESLEEFEDEFDIR